MGIPKIGEKMRFFQNPLMGRFGKFGFPKQLILIVLEHFSDHLALFFYFLGVVKDCCGEREREN